MGNFFDSHYMHSALYAIARPSVRLSGRRVDHRTRSQAVARIADRTASQQTLVISDALPMKLHAVNSTSFRLLYHSTNRITPS